MLRGSPVAPLAGAWIEIGIVSTVKGILNVAPLAGAWIEMRNRLWPLLDWMSLPLRERGLKYENFKTGVNGKMSLPLRERGLKLKPEVNLLCK